MEDAVVRIRKQLTEDGLDAGARTIQWHLQKEIDAVPSISTIWRVLARGFVIPQPEKRPHASFIRFEAGLSNECWQADVTHWLLKGGADVDILTFIDDHSRMVVASRVTGITKVHDVVNTFHEAGARFGYPASVLTDNAAVFNAAARRGTNAFEVMVAGMGVLYKHSRPYHPQTCGKIERWHQTLKRFLDQQKRARSIRELQAQLDRFVVTYNEE